MIQPGTFPIGKVFQNIADLGISGLMNKAGLPPLGMVDAPLAMATKIPGQLGAAAGNLQNILDETSYFGAALPLEIGQDIATKIGSGIQSLFIPKQTSPYGSAPTKGAYEKNLMTTSAGPGSLTRDQILNNYRMRKESQATINPEEAGPTTTGSVYGGSGGVKMEKMKPLGMSPGAFGGIANL